MADFCDWPYLRAHLHRYKYMEEMTMKFTTVLFALATILGTAACSTPSARGPATAGMEITQMPGFVNNAKVFRIKDMENGVVCYGTVASEDSAQASAGHFACLTNKPAGTPAPMQTTP
jgi:hypothetical protein